MDMTDEERFLAFLEGAKIKVGNKEEVQKSTYEGVTDYDFFYGDYGHWADFSFDKTGKSIGYTIGN